MKEDQSTQFDEVKKEKTSLWEEAILRSLRLNERDFNRMVGAEARLHWTMERMEGKKKNEEQVNSIQFVWKDRAVVEWRDPSLEGRDF